MRGSGDSSGGKILKYCSNACALAGFIIALFKSGFVGMPLGATPWASVSTIVLWIAALLLGYFAFDKGHRAGRPSPLWLKLCSFVSHSSSIILTLMILFGYLFYPTVREELRGALERLLPHGVALRDGSCHQRR